MKDTKGRIVAFPTGEKADTITQLELTRLFSLRKTYLDALDAYEHEVDSMTARLERGADIEKGPHTADLSFPPAELLIS